MKQQIVYIALVVVDYDAKIVLTVWHKKQAISLISTLVFSPFRMGHLFTMSVAPLMSFARMMIYPATEVWFSV